MDEPTADREAVAAFAGRVYADWGGAHTIALAYIGDRLGLFRVIADADGLTSEELASRTGLNERYLREWTAALAAAEYIEYDPQRETFAMTPEQTVVLANEGDTAFLGGGF